MQSKRKKLHILRNTDSLKKQSCLEQLKQEELKRLDFNKTEYEFFIENCNFTDRQKQILDLRRKGKSIIEITFISHLSERTVYRELKKIKHKIYKII